MDDLYHIADSLGNLLAERHLTFSTVESCTGGGLAYALTAIPGCSKWFRCGWVTYSNESKQDLVDVPEEIIKAYGAVSEPVAKAMAHGGLLKSASNVCMAVTGIAGPTGGTEDKPIGTVWVSLAYRNSTVSGSETLCLSLSGDRENIRKQAIIETMKECKKLIQALTL
jgi:nicotinamide-nucleotide amidase